MITIGVQTKGILPERSIEDGASRIAAAGFTHVDFNLDAFLKNSDIYKGKLNPFFSYSEEQLTAYFTTYKEGFAAHGLRPSQMHAPYPLFVMNRADVTEYMQQVVVPKAIAIAEVMEIPWVVMHPFKLQYGYGMEAEKAMNLQFFLDLIPSLKEHGVHVCVENLYEGVGGRITEGTCAEAADAIDYVDFLNEMAKEELFGICLDTGHLQLTHREPAAYIKAVGKRLKIFHLHENDGVGDLHQMPFSFGNSPECGTDWDAFADALRDVGFDGTLSFETYPCMNSFPRGTEDEVLRTIHSIGEYLKDRIEGEAE
jgi:sugar phosphate isomerase/epimerase